MLHIVLHKPEMPANVGNIIRTAAALNAKLHIIGPLTFTLDNKSLKRAGLDYIDPHMLFYYESLAKFMANHQDAFIVYVTRYSSQNYTTFDYGRFDKPIFCMFGSESYGIPRDVLSENKKTSVRIPMAADARSLNLSNAVAVVSYEIMRQQDFYNLATSEVIKGDDFLE